MDEKKTIRFMIELYCKKKHGEDKGCLCDSCLEILNYAYKRIENCRYKESKTFCSVCKTHCYSPDMRVKIREVMKFSGPRMIIHNPKLAISHVICTVKEKMKWKRWIMKKLLLNILGIVGLILGYIGAVLPLIPAFPFLLLAAYCFGKSNEKLDKWFKSTKLYKNNLETYVKGEGMTNKTKIKVVSLVSVLMAIGFMCMGDVPVGRIVLVFVWLFHVIYFKFFVKTINEEDKSEAEETEVNNS